MDYVELHCHSCFSLLDGASSPEELLDRAAQLGMGALALTDHDALYGAVRFYRAAQARGIKPILGAELTLTGGHHLVLLARDRRGWANLCRLISLAHRAAPGKGRAALPLAALRGRTEGLICLSGCRRGEIAAHLLAGRPEAALAAGERYVELFGRDGFYVELERHVLPDEGPLLDSLVELAGRLGVGYVATNNVHYAERGGHRLQDVLVCIRHHTTLDESAHLRRPNSEYYLKSPRQMASLFPAYPEALEATRLIADRCRFQLGYGLQDLPRFPTPGGTHPASYLRRLCEEGVSSRYPAPTPRLREQMAHELAVIDELGLANYFLIVWDIVRFARQREILCQGRGSAANSVVAFLLGITPIDPLAHDLVFERFLSRERRMTPDIDIDFQADRRQEVIRYVYQRYGEEHAAMACTFVTFRARSALRDVGKALGFPPELLDRAARALDTYQAGDIAASPGFAEALGDRMEHLPSRLLLELCRQIEGFPRHLSIHNGGMIITASPLVEVVPTEPAAMPGRVVVQWDKDSLEDVGLVKIDLLGLRALSAMAEAVETVEQATGKRPLVSGLTFDDPQVYDLICAGDTVGVFQLESRAQAQMIPRLKPRNFQDLIVETSLVRPGPLRGDMVRPYLRRRRGEEPVSYLHPLLETALAETLGVIVFQEQVLKVARDLAGFTPGKAELLRRALGKGEEVGRWREAFIRGAAGRGVPESVAEGVFEKLLAFGGYSFPKSHAASFAVLVYRSAWLKRYYPLAFYAAILDSQPMGFWSPEVVAEDAKRHGVRIL
ncbi:MAG: DNA polymerase III subunit alpha, partial [Chloroflexota bacterium]|nr:DNA polymerase III subunit alpha [Chloroflexota bacterium]